jgi:enoyl-CoA hydratase
MIHRGVMVAQPHDLAAIQPGVVGNNAIRHEDMGPKMRKSHAAMTLLKRGMAEINPGLRSHRRKHDMGNSGMVERRSLLKAAAAFGGLSTLAVIAPAVSGAAQERDIPAAASPEVKLEDVPAGPNSKVTIERRGQIVLIGINRPYIQNRIDPETFKKLAEAYYQYDHDTSLRAAILFGHGENFSRGIDVEGFKSLAGTGKPWISSTGTIDPLAKRAPRLTKPLIVVTHGDTWNMAHELHLVADIRIAAADTRFGQDENTHGRFPGGGSTIRFPREVGWGNAMRYMLTGDHWNAEEAYRIGEVQQVAPTPEKALDAGILIANKIAACGPLGIKTTLISAHLAVDPGEEEALSKLDAQFATLFHTQDFLEGVKAEAEGRKPVFQGK